MKKTTLRIIASALLLAFFTDIAWSGSNYSAQNSSLAPHSIFKQSNPPESSLEFEKTTISNI